MALVEVVQVGCQALDKYLAMDISFRRSIHSLKSV